MVKLKIKQLLTSKILLWIVTGIALLEGIYIYLTHDLTRIVMMPSYKFEDSADSIFLSDSSEIVSAEGSWLSTSKLGMPLQTVKIECFQSNMQCVFATANLDNNFLSVFLDLEDVNRWDKDEIVTVPSETGFGCVEYTYRIDRRSKTVTGLRRTINQERFCEGTSEEPIPLTLGSGWERIKNK